MRKPKITESQIVTFLVEGDAGFDLPPTNRTKLKLVKSVHMEADGHEEQQIYR